MRAILEAPWGLLTWEPYCSIHLHKPIYQQALIGCPAKLPTPNTKENEASAEVHFKTLYNEVHSCCLHSQTQRRYSPVPGPPQHSHILVNWGSKDGVLITIHGVRTHVHSLAKWRHTQIVEDLGRTFFFDSHAIQPSAPADYLRYSTQKRVTMLRFSGCGRPVSDCRCG